MGSGFVPEGLPLQSQGPWLLNVEDALGSGDEEDAGAPRAYQAQTGDDSPSDGDSSAGSLGQERVVDGGDARGYPATWIAEDEGGQAEDHPRLHRGGDCSRGSTECQTLNPKP